MSTLKDDSSTREMGRILDPQATGVNDPNEIIQKFHGAFGGTRDTRSVSFRGRGWEILVKSMVFMGTSSRNGGFSRLPVVYHSLSINGGFSSHLCGQWRVQSNDFLTTADGL